LIKARPKNDLLDVDGPCRQVLAFFSSLERIELRTSAKAGQHAAVSADFQ